MDDEDYLLGTDFLGAATAPGEGPFVTIHIKDLAGVAKAKGGALGGFAASLLPQTIGSKAYGDMATQIKDKMKEQGVDADVKVVQVSPPGSPFGRDLFIGLLMGGLVMFGGLFLLAKVVARRRGHPQLLLAGRA